MAKRFRKSGVQKEFEKNLPRGWKVDKRHNGFYVLENHDWTGGISVFDAGQYHPGPGLRWSIMVLGPADEEIYWVVGFLSEEEAFESARELMKQDWVKQAIRGEIEIDDKNWGDKIRHHHEFIPEWHPAYWVEVDDGDDYEKVPAGTESHGETLGYRLSKNRVVTPVTKQSSSRKGGDEPQYFVKGKGRPVTRILETYNGDLYFIVEGPDKKGNALAYARLYSMPEMAEWGWINLKYLKSRDAYGRNNIWPVREEDWMNVNTYEKGLLVER